MSLKEYAATIDNIADTIVKDHYSLIESDSELGARATADTSKLKSIVKKSVEELEDDSLIEVISQNPTYLSLDEEISKMSVPNYLLLKLFSYNKNKITDAIEELKTCFVDENEPILKDCINDIESRAEELGDEYFCESYDNAHGF